MKEAAELKLEISIEVLVTSCFTTPKYEWVKEEAQGELIFNKFV